MSSNLECLGLGVADQAAFVRLVSGALSDAVLLGRSGDVDVVRWQDPSGARLVMGLRDGELLDLLPSFAGEPGALLSGVRMANDEVSTAAVLDDDGEQATALALELEQRRFLAGDVTGRAAVTALGVQVEVFADADAFGTSDASLLSPDRDRDSEPPEQYRENGWPWPPRMAAESFISYGVFGEPADATAHARLAGVVLHASRRTTALTGQAFTVARVRTAGFESDVCLAADAHPQVPEPGAVVSGTVFLVGDLPLSPG